MKIIKVKKKYLFCLKPVIFTEIILPELVPRNALIPNKIAHIKVTVF